VKVVSGEAPVDHLYGADFDDAVAFLRIEAGGFGV
jgi:hypothetical protein